MDENEFEYERIEQYRPLGAWAYFGYSLLYLIPVVGLIFAIIFACSNKNYNRRNQARGFLILLAIGLACALITNNNSWTLLQKYVSLIVR